MSAGRSDPRPARGRSRSSNPGKAEQRQPQRLQARLVEEHVLADFGVVAIDGLFALSEPGFCQGRVVLGDLPLALGFIALVAGDVALVPQEIVEVAPEEEYRHERNGDRRGQCRHRRPPLRPHPKSFRGTDRPAEGRHSVQESSQFFREVLGGRVSSGRVFSQAAQANGFQVARDVRARCSQSGRLVLENHFDRLARRAAAERRTAGEHLVKNRPERIHVRGGADFMRSPGRLLRRHVTRRAENADRRRLGNLLRLLGEAEVRNFELVSCDW